MVPPASFSRASTKRFTSRFRQRALEQVGDLALPEGGDGGDGLQRQAELGELLDQGAVLVDVDLDQLHPAAGGCARPFPASA